jgi:Xaa-Pro dipeptidase
MTEIQFYEDDWSQLSAHRDMPEIDDARMLRYRLDRVRNSLRSAGASMGIFVSPVSLRYAVEYRGYALFQSHIPSTYTVCPRRGAGRAAWCLWRAITRG